MQNYPALEPHLQHYLGSSASKLLQHLKKQNEAMIMSMAMKVPPATQVKEPEKEQKPNHLPHQNK